MRVDAAGEGVRLDRWFRRLFPDVPHGALEKLLRKGAVRVDNARARAGTRLTQGQNVQIPPLARRDVKERVMLPMSKAEIRALRERVLFRDDDIIALNKPAGLAVQGGNRLVRHVDSMCSALCYDYDEPPKLIHRLDKATSGVLLLSRRPQAAAHMAAIFKKRQVEKIYWAVCHGAPKASHGTIIAPAGREGRPAQTKFQLLERAGDKFSLIAFMPVTGRTHQIRSHAAGEGLPIVGDKIYGLRGQKPSAGFGKGLHLLARAVCFINRADEQLYISAPLPDDMRKTMQFLGWGGEKDYDQTDYRRT